MENSKEIEISDEMLVGGIKVSYYILCKTKLWLFSHSIAQEKESELVILGRLIEESAYKQTRFREVLVDSKISIDLIRKGREIIISDIKKSSKLEKAHVFQMLYYLWYLKKLKGIENVKGMILYPKERRKFCILLDEEKEKEIERIIFEISKIASAPFPPKPIYKKYCRKCAYFEFCFSD